MRSNPSSAGRTVISPSVAAEGAAAQLPGGLMPILILPAMGCDTALLTRLLDHHPQVYAPAGSISPRIDSPDEARSLFVSLADEAIREATMSLRRGGQSTLSAFCISLLPESDQSLVSLLHAQPDAPVLCPIRDGRDAIVEERVTELRSGNFERYSPAARAHAARAAASHAGSVSPAACRSTPQSLFCPESLRLHINRWIESLQAPMRTRELIHDRARLIRHEDLVLETTRSHAATCRWLGIAGDSSHVHGAIEASRSQLAAAAKPGNWRRLLSEADKAIFKRMAGELLVELGYVPDTRW